MLHRREMIGWLTVAILFTGPLALSGATPELQRPQAVAQIEVGPTLVDWLPQVGDYERLILTVAGPGDFYIRQEFGPGEAPSFSSLDAQGGHLPDGVYAYELRTVSRRGQQLQDKPLVQSGHLWLHDGSFVDKVPAQPSPSIPNESASKPPRRNITAKDIVKPDDVIVQGQACIGSDCVDGDADSGPILLLKELFGGQIKFDASVNCCVPYSIDWALQANDSVAGNGDFTIRDLTQATIPFRIGASAPDNALTILYNGNVGLGTLTPAVRLDVKGSASGAATERLQNSSATGYSGTEYLNNAGTVSLFFGVDNAASTTRLNSVNNHPIAIFTNSVERMRITSAGDVGIGTTNPGSKLEVEQNTDANVIAAIENTNTGLTANAVWRTVSDTTTMNLISHSSTRTATRFGQTLGGASELMSYGGTKMLIGTLEADDMILGTNNTNRLQINGSTGTVTVSGNLIVNGTFSNPSSRSLKEGFAPVDPSIVLKKFALLPINEWSYRNDDRKLRHVGPTVEDFQSAFGLGTEGTHIFPTDVQGVTMAAVQGLYQLVQELVQEKDAQIDELQKELHEIKQLLLEKADKN